jgi:hypothetical protein
MTQIDNEAVERLAQTVRDRAGGFPDANVFDDAATMLRALRATLDAAEAEKRAAVAAAYEKAAQRVARCSWGDYWNDDGILVDPETLGSHIRALAQQKTPPAD